MPSQLRKMELGGKSAHHHQERRWGRWGRCAAAALSALGGGSVELVVQAHPRVGQGDEGDVTLCIWLLAAGDGQWVHGLAGKGAHAAAVRLVWEGNSLLPAGASSGARLCPALDSDCEPSYVVYSSFWLFLGVWTQRFFLSSRSVCQLSQVFFFHPNIPFFTILALLVTVHPLPLTFSCSSPPASSFTRTTPACLPACDG
jgi:hypothetical protein